MTCAARRCWSQGWHQEIVILRAKLIHLKEDREGVVTEKPELSWKM
jgi:hypothetical protein